MSVLFNKIRRGDPSNPSIPRLCYLVLKSAGLVARETPVLASERGGVSAEMSYHDGEND
jgi:hypothetical protein